jgi:hypothetical protein
MVHLLPISRSREQLGEMLTFARVRPLILDKRQAPQTCNHLKKLKFPFSQLPL